MNFTFHNKDLEISTVARSASEVKDLFLAYNIRMEEEGDVEEEDEDEPPDFLQPIVEMTYDESEEETSFHINSDHVKAKMQLDQLNATKIHNYEMRK